MLSKRPTFSTKDLHKTALVILNLELEAEILKMKQLIVEKEKRCSFIETEYQELELKFQKYKECFGNLQLKEELTTVRIKNDSFMDENVSIKKRYQDLYKSKAESNSNVSSGAAVRVKPRVLALGLYAMTPKCSTRTVIIDPHGIEGRFDVFFRNQLLVFQKHQDESLYDSWTRFKDIIRKVLNHGLSIWTLIEIFFKHLDSLSRHIINLIAEGDLKKFSDIGAWVHVPRCMTWLEYGEHVDSLSTMDNEVGVISPESTTQTLSSFEEYISPMTYPKEVEKTLGTPIEEVPSFDGPEPQSLLNCSSLDASLRDVIGPEPPIKPYSPDSSRMKVVDYLTTQTPPSPHVANSHPKGVYNYYNPGIDEPKRHYGFKPGLLGKSVSLGVDISNWEMFDDDWGLESKEVSPLGEELSLFDRLNKVERGRILETCSFMLRDL
nr:hypothetical protein [Tanacetum cinerariifolium]